MCIKMIKHGIAIVGITILAFLSIACASLEGYDEIPPEHLSYMWSSGGKYIIETSLRSDGFNDLYLIQANVKASLVNLDNDSRPYLIDRIEANKVYRVYLTNIVGRGFFIDRIDGLMSIEEGQVRSAARIAGLNPIPGETYEELQARITQVNADRARAEEAQRQRQAQQRQAQEEARQAREEEYRMRFIVVPSANFEPANYNANDLFSVVAWVERRDVSDYISRSHVSDVVFVRQDGTDIRFTTDDNAISQDMRIDVRSGLTSGQRVRLYYEVTKARYRLPVWQVIAIEPR
jgi:hypothetical protein